MIVNPCEFGVIKLERGRGDGVDAAARVCASVSRDDTVASMASS